MRHDYGAPRRRPCGNFENFENFGLFDRLIGAFAVFARRKLCSWVMESRRIGMAVFCGFWDVSRETILVLFVDCWPTLRLVRASGSIFFFFWYGAPTVLVFRWRQRGVRGDESRICRRRGAYGLGIRRRSSSICRSSFRFRVRSLRASRVGRSSFKVCSLV